MIGSEVREWIDLATGKVGALVVLLIIAGVFGKWIDTELKITVENQNALIQQQREQLEIMREGQALMARNQEILVETLQLERDQYTAIRQLMFQNVDRPEQP